MLRLNVRDFSIVPITLTTTAVRMASSGSIARAHTTEDMSSPDHGFEKDRIQKAAGDGTRREFAYFMLGGARFVYASAARLALIKVSLRIAVIR